MGNKKEKSLSEELLEIKDKIREIDADIENKKAFRKSLLDDYNEKKKGIDGGFDKLFEYVKDQIVGEENFKSGNKIASIFPKSILCIYGVNSILKKLTDAAEKKGYHREVRYTFNQRTYAFFKNEK